MQFTLHRNYTLRSTTGLSITFVKGKPTHVPPRLVKEAMGIGAVPVDPAAIEQVEKLETSREQRRDEAIDPMMREKRVREMLGFMRERNLREYFTASGSPSLKHLSLLCGFEVDKNERDKLWQEMLGTGDDEEPALSEAKPTV